MHVLLFTALEGYLLAPLGELLATLYEVVAPAAACLCCRYAKRIAAGDYSAEARRLCLGPAPVCCRPLLVLTCRHSLGRPLPSCRLLLPPAWQHRGCCPGPCPAPLGSPLPVAQTGFAVDLALKDVGHMRRLAQETTCPLPFADTAFNVSALWAARHTFPAGPPVRDAYPAGRARRVAAAAAKNCRALPAASPAAPAASQGQARRPAGLGRDQPGCAGHGRAAAQHKGQGSVRSHEEEGSRHTLRKEIPPCLHCPMHEDLLLPAIATATRRRRAAHTPSCTGEGCLLWAHRHAFPGLQRAELHRCAVYTVCKEAKSRSSRCTVSLAAVSAASAMRRSVGTGLAASAALEPEELRLPAASLAPFLVSSGACCCCRLPGSSS